MSHQTGYPLVGQLEDKNNQITSLQAVSGRPTSFLGHSDLFLLRQLCQFHTKHIAQLPLSVVEDMLETSTSAWRHHCGDSD